MTPLRHRTFNVALALAALLGAAPGLARHSPLVAFAIEEGVVVVQFATAFELLDPELVVSSDPETPLAVLAPDSVVADASGQAVAFLLPDAVTAGSTAWLILELSYDDPDDREPRRWHVVAYFACDQGRCERATSVAWQLAHGLLTREEDPSGRVVYDAPAAVVKAGNNGSGR